jgi:bifunctional non-homologous end joining protein LigD
MVAFDLLYLNGYDLRSLPLVERKALLKQTIDKTDIQFSESFERDGGEMLRHACKTCLEGVVSKVQRETADCRLKDNRFDGLYIGRQKGKELIYAGKVDHGFDTASAKDLQVLQARLKP